MQVAIPLIVRRFPLEAIIWLLGFAFLAFLEPGSGHVTICPVALLGLEWCPGCGLGRSVSQILHGDFIAGFVTHPLGPVAILILSFRIISLTKKHISIYGKDS